MTHRPLLVGEEARRVSKHACNEEGMKESLTSSAYWSMTEGIFNCLIDTRRTHAFARAIRRTVREGDVVVDMGSGSGVLAMLAAKAGAKVVYAIENDPNNLRHLQATFALNGFGDAIRVIEGSVLEVVLPEKVDVVIGEMIATALIEELQVPAMNHILKFAKRNVRVLLQRYDTKIDLVHNRNRYYGLQFDIPRYEYPGERILESLPLSKKALVHSHDFTRLTEDFRVERELSIRTEKSGVCNGLRLSGTTTFCDGSRLGATFAYSYPLILPVPAMRVKPGATFDVTLTYIVAGGMGSLKYSVTDRSRRATP